MASDLRLRQNSLNRLRMDDYDHNFLWLRDHLGGTVPVDTYDNWMTVKNNGNLPAGGQIIISDRGPLGTIMLCTTSSTFSRDCISSFYVADIQRTNSSCYGVWNQQMEEIVLTLDYANKEQYTISVQPYYDISSFAYGQSVSLVDGGSNTLSVGYILSVDLFANSFVFEEIINYGDINTSANMLNNSLETGPFLVTGVNYITQYFYPGELVWAENDSFGYVTNVDSNTQIRVARSSDSFLSGTNITGSLSKYTANYTVTEGISGFPGSSFVIWDNIHYAVIDDSQFNGNSPNENSSAYSPLEISLENGYLVEWDEIVYDFDNDQILWRKDKRNNKIPYSYSNYNSFQWGDDNIHDYICENYYSQVYTINNRGEITGKQVGDYTFVYAGENSGFIFTDVNGTYQSLYVPNNTGDIEGHVRGFSSGLEAENNRGDMKVYIEDSSYVYAQDNFGDVYCKYANNSYVSHLLNIGDFMHCSFDTFNSGSFNILSLDSGVSHFNCSYSNNLDQFVFPRSRNYSNCELTNTSSSFASTLDISGKSSIDLSIWNFCGDFTFITQDI